jgi:hypothetical protein
LHRLAHGQLDLDLRRIEECVVNKAMVDRAGKSLRLVFRQERGTRNMNAKIAEPGRLFQLFGGYGDLYAMIVEIAGLQVLHGVKGCAGTQGREQKLRGCHAAILASIFRWLVAKDGMRPGMNCEFNLIKVRDPYFHRVSPFQ